MYLHPTLLLDEAICKRNIMRMAEKANDQQVIFRPHFKTHQSVDVGSWFREAGVQKIAVSSVKMAEYFIHSGWKDVHIAFPVNIREIDSINSLAEKANIHLTVDSLYVVEFLTQRLKHKVGIYLEIDEGYGRTGIAYDQNADIHQIMQWIQKSPVMHMEGFMAHFGQTYSARNTSEVRQIYMTSMKKLTGLKNEFKVIYPNIKLSVGDTPSCSVLDDFLGVDEIRPGNFVFFDVMQSVIGSCNTHDIAVVCACPVVAIYPQRSELAVYGGAVHLSKEGFDLPTGVHIFGWVVKLKNGSWSEPIPNTFVSRISQEHGIIKSTTKFIKELNPGDVIGILPVHSCLTANLAPYYVSTGGRRIAKMRQ